MNVDVAIKPFDFDDTEVEIEAVSERGRAFLAKHIGFGAVGATLKMSGLDAMDKEAEREGLVVGEKSETYGGQIGLQPFIK